MDLGDAKGIKGLIKYFFPCEKTPRANGQSIDIVVNIVDRGNIIHLANAMMIPVVVIVFVIAVMAVVIVVIVIVIVIVTTVIVVIVLVTVNVVMMPMIVVMTMVRIIVMLVVVILIVVRMTISMMMVMPIVRRIRFRRFQSTLYRPMRVRNLSSTPAVSPHSNSCPMSISTLFGGVV